MARSASATAAIRPDFDVHQSATYLTQFVGAPCYSTLLRADPHDYNKLVADLAEKWDISADGKTVTFHLHGGVVFHDGTPLTAEDVIYSLDRIRKPPRGIVSPRKGLLGNIASIEAGGPLTVVIRLTEPQPDFLFMVSNPYNVIVPKKVCEPLDAQGQGMKRQIVGTGPFRLTQSIDGQIYELTRFDGYFGEKAYLDKIQFFPIKGEVERGAALQGKRIDAGFFFPNEAVLATLAQSSRHHRTAAADADIRQPHSKRAAKAVRRHPRPRGAVAGGGPRGLHQDGGTARRRVLPQHWADAAGQSVQPER